jgi:hypothetical protein
MSPSSLPGRAIVILAAFATLIIFSLAIIVVRSRNASRQAANDMAVVLRAQAPVLAQVNKREQQRDAILFSPANTVRADAADGTSAFFQCSAALAEIPEKTRRRHAGILECKLHTICLLCRAGRLVGGFRSLINYNCRFLSPEYRAW